MSIIECAPPTYAEMDIENGPSGLLREHLAADPPKIEATLAIVADDLIRKQAVIYVKEQKARKRKLGTRLYVSFAIVFLLTLVIGAITVSLDMRNPPKETSLYKVAWIMNCLSIAGVLATCVMFAVATVYCYG
jgi:uncharacterized membrane protein